MRLIKRLLCILLLLLPLAVAGSYLFKSLDAKDGLTSSQINCILKDSRGFMWMGTPAGLYRYDGYTFKHFQSDSQDGSSLPDSYIISLQEWTGDGSLWVKTSTGYCIYHPESESFERDMHQAFGKIGVKDVPDIVYRDRQKNIWGVLQKKKLVVCFNTEQQTLFEFTMNDDSNGLPEGQVCSISECKDGAIFVYDNGMMACCDVTHQQRVVWINRQVAQQGLRKSSSLHAFADQHDNIWLYGQGTLFVLNKRTGVWDTTIGNQLGLTGNGVDYAVNSMAGDRKGNIWIATNRHGLIKANVDTHLMEVTQPTMMNAAPTQLMTTNGKPYTPTVGIRSVYVDNTDLLWVGTAKSGVAFWGENIYKFVSSPLGDITAMTQGSDSAVWYGTSDNGIVGFGGQLASLHVTAMATTPDGSIWVGSQQNGLTRIQNGTTTIYSQKEGDAITLIDDHIHALCTDKNGSLWIATEKGLQTYNLRMNTFTSYTKKRNNLQTDNVTALCYGKGNNMLIGLSEGLTIMNLSTGEMKHYTGNPTNTKRFTNTYVTQVCEDSRGLIWIGTREGINVLNMESGELDYITEKQGLCNNNVCGITEDKNHSMWITTSNGVCRIVLERNHEEGRFNYGLYNYNQSDGLQGNEFNPGAIITKKNGEVLLGGLYGVSRIRPKTADEREKLPSVILSQLFIGEEEILTGHEYDGHVVLPQALATSHSIKLGNSQNTFTIKFAAGDYNLSERMQYQAKVEGLDSHYWHYDALKHGVVFTDVPFGTYKLTVKAMTDEGKRAISDQETVLTITIGRPWWAQTWMLVIYAMLAIVLVYIWKKGIDQMRAMWKKKKAVLAELALQREEIKATSDDLRQPMSRMTSIIMNLSERDTSIEEREQLNSLHSQMLQVITRVSDMQSLLENPEQKAKQKVNRQFQLDSHGEMTLPDTVSDELTYEIKSNKGEQPVSGFTMFLIDDNDSFRKYIVYHLHSIYEVHAYADARTALLDIETLMPDIVVCKQDLPGMTGTELCNKIKSNTTLYKIKFVLLTDAKLSGKEMVAKDLTMAADDYLGKPFNLQEAVARFNKLHRPHRGGKQRDRRCRDTHARRPQLEHDHSHRDHRLRQLQTHAGRQRRRPDTGRDHQVGTPQRRGGNAHRTARRCLEHGRRHGPAPAQQH